MSQPPLYKYLDVPGARLTLGNRTFKHSKPSDFNDIEDLTIQSIFPEEVDQAVIKIARNFTNVILRNIDVEPTCASSMKEKIQVLQKIYRDNPDLSEKVQADLRDSENSSQDIAYFRGISERHLVEINEYMQGYRVFCVSSLRDSDHMWSEYAEGHKGVCLRIEPNTAKYSKFQLFRPVVYRERRPPLYEDAIEFIEAALFGDQDTRVKEVMDRIIYSKTLDWAAESEYRLAIPIGEGEEPWETLPYHPEEITELYLGSEMEAASEEEIAEMALQVNSKIAVFRVKRDGYGELVFESVKG